MGSVTLLGHYMKLEIIGCKTRMPEKLEASATAGFNAQGFDQYGTHGTYPAYCSGHPEKLTIP